MSQATLKKLIALCEQEEKYTPIVRDRLRSLGVNDQIMSTIAGYYEVLDRLASE